MRRHVPSLFTLALAAALLGAPARAAEVEAYLPADTEAVVFLNVRQILDSAVVKKHAREQLEAELKKNNDAQQFIKATGLDPLRDVASVLVAIPTEVTAGKALLVVRGNFDLTKIADTLEKHAAANKDELKITKEGTLTVYEGKGKGANDQTAYFTFLDRETVIASPSKPYLLASAKKGSGPRQELKDLIGKVDSKQSLWLVATVPDVLQQLLAGNPQTANIAKALKSFTGNVAVTDAVQATITVNTTDAKAANEVRKLLDGLKGILAFAAQQGAQNNQELGMILSDLVDGIKIVAKDTSVVLTGKVDAEVIDKAVKNAKKN